MLAAVFFLILPAIGRADQEHARAILLFPIQSHWLSAPLADSLTEALSTSLTQAGLRTTVVRADGLLARMAVAERWVEQAELAAGDLWPLRDKLAVAAQADASLLGELIEAEGQLALRIRVAATVSGREAAFTQTGPVPDRPDEWQATARALAAKVAASLTPELWAEIGADQEGRRAAAAARSASGQAALAQGMYREAMLDFEAALLGDPDNPDHLSWAAEARVQCGDPEGALAKLRHLDNLAPYRLAAKLRLGDIALIAGRPEEAAAAFLAAEQLQPDDPRAIEGVARAARARGDFARSESCYDSLLPLLGLSAVHWTGADQDGRIISGESVVGPCQSFPSTLAHLTEDSIRLAGTPREELPFQLARICLRAGRVPAAVEALADYHQRAQPRPYTDAEYLELFPALDEESEDIARQAQTLFAARALGQLGDEPADAEMEALHDRSDRLATLAERMRVSPALDPAHRFRVLAYNLLNESNFEALLFLRTGDAERQRRAELLRDASGKARAQARQLGEALVGAVSER